MNTPHRVFQPIGNNTYRVAHIHRSAVTGKYETPKDSMFTSPHHERITRAIATAFEYEVWKRRNMCYAMKTWEKLPHDCQQEFADVATAAIKGTTYNGRELPQWVKNVAHPAT